MTDFSEPADPINGAIPGDGEYRIAGSTVEQWTQWAGMWDVAFHALSVADAERYVRENTARVTSTYRVAGLRRVQGAIGVFEPFVTEHDRETVEAASSAAVQECYAGGFDVQIRAVVRVTNIAEQVAALGSAYWRARWADGGTITDDKDNLVDTSPEAKRIYKEMGEVTERAAVENEATLERCGVPTSLAKLLASHEDITLEATCLRWTGHSPVDHYQLDRVISPPLKDVEAWSDSFRTVWTDDERLMITYCEGDLSGRLFFTSEAFKAAYAEAGRFYESH